MTKEESSWFRKRTWGEVNLDNLASNLEIIRNRVGENCQIMGVVKSDAYGHSDQMIAPELEKLGVDWLAVSELEEALALRRYGITKPILNFTGIPLEYIDVAVNANITTVIPSYEYALKLNSLCAEKKIKMQAYISVDTGIGRLGLEATEDKQADSIEKIKLILELENIDITGMYTHYAYNGNPIKEALDYTELQYNRFIKVLDALKAQGIELPLISSSNSDAMTENKKFHFDIVRQGMNFYDGSPKFGFKPLMSLKTKITHIKDVAAGTSISYNCIFKAERPTKVATVSVGYGDGYHRAMNRKAMMIVRGKKIPVIGSICMDQLMLDVTDVEGVSIGDIVTMVGTDGESTITWGDLGKWADSVNYEMMCGITRRVPRIYQKGGKDVGCVAYQEFVPM